ncbi:phosphatase PAP2 family protein [Aliicoccus persicus]|uniref:Undecaprenyl-diphosphatase n=1 Tax=Aliicoccus persicus TaxID=930138 RepID=A0A662Z4B1_9STAP|nr:phosphatase PAP2 family protein [Aliicoccus persicus]SEV91664.1 undecaprenyl-diphosphatase [Aliicoccus persicus]
MVKKLGITGIIFLLLFVFVTIAVITDSLWVNRFDNTLTTLIQGQVTESGSSFVAVATDIADFMAVTILTVATVVILFVKRMYIASLWFGFTVLICAWFLMDTMKVIIGRERPDELVITMETSLSYPSGHSIASVLFYGFLALGLILTMKKASYKIIVGILVALIVLFVLASRVYLGVHYPTDVIGGLFFGLASIFISASLYQLALPRLQQWMKKKNWKDQSPSLG